MLLSVAVVGIVSIAVVGYIHRINTTVAEVERDDIDNLERERDHILDPIDTPEEAEQRRAEKFR